MNHPHHYNTMPTEMRKITVAINTSEKNSPDKPSSTKRDQNTQKNDHSNNNDRNYQKNTLHPTPCSNLIKTSTLTTKTEGWQQHPKQNKVNLQTK